MKAGLSQVDVEREQFLFYDRVMCGVDCPKCYARYGHSCYWIHRSGNHAYLIRPHRERIALFNERERSKQTEVYS